MPTGPRIHFNISLAEGQTIEISDKNRLNYISTVLRLKIGAKIRVFNHNDGEFIAHIVQIDKKKIIFNIENQFRSTKEEPELILALSIIKLDRFLEAIRASVQIGVTSIIPVISQRTQFRHVPHEKIEAILEQSVQQSERFQIPELKQPTKLEDLLKDPNIAQIIVADETISEQDGCISSLKPKQQGLCVLIGPEGGFGESEIDLLHRTEHTNSISLGSNILRAETAAIVALGCVAMIRREKNGPKN